MTNTAPESTGSPQRRRKSGHESAVGKRTRKRTATDIGLAVITPIVGQEFLDKYKLRDPLNRALRYGIKQTFSVAGATSRQFKRVKGLTGGRSEEHTSELQSRGHLVCRLLLEKKKKQD